ncbi:MAG: hypothetical protein M9936_14310 [Caldilinea sp.]|nr:hypothetical protein [Caldilinea sp.]MCB0146273.1 hypothetical protein [Caldilineaceae bacterium]MCO5210862.1 hypothetical protein [Caldilinea sp.]MCW5842702.1 hypothetical protein [Caldilinea sp.]
MTTRTMQYRIPAELERTEAIAAAQPDRYAPLRKVAQSLTRRGVMAAKVELVNQALATLVDLVFEIDDDGRYANQDIDGRILIPLPWGRLGRGAWGLRATEGAALRYIMLQRQHTEPEPLFTYDAGGRTWCVNLAFTSRRMAMSYLRTTPVTLGEWRHAWESTRSAWSVQNMADK